MRVTGTVHEDLCSFVIISPEFSLECEMFQTHVVEKIKTRILCSVHFFSKIPAVYEIMRKNVGPDRSQMAI